jgi:hypothetical protein
VDRHVRDPEREAGIEQHQPAVDAHNHSDFILSVGPRRSSKTGLYEQDSVGQMHFVGGPFEPQLWNESRASETSSTVLK